jgi:predicted alpha/beta superfamily hydrolase
MKILSKTNNPLFSDSEVLLVKSELADDIFRICVTAPARPVMDGGRAGVIFATDAELSAGSLISTLRSCANGFDLPALYGVSIGYALDANPPFALRRTRDLTPTYWPAFGAVMPAMMGLSGETSSGGAKAFLEFIEQELKPELAAHFPMNIQDATLTGQSFGGLFVLYTLLHKPEAFRRYLAVSPSLWWDAKKMLLSTPNFAPHDARSNAAVYMCAGQLENQDRFQAQISSLPDSTRCLLPKEMVEVEMHDDMFHMESALRTLSAGKASIETHIYPEESHESIMGAALSRGLRSLYGNLKRS